MQNSDVARRLEEVAQLLEAMGANPHRVRAYHRAAATVSRLDRTVSELVSAGGADRLRALPGIGPQLSRAICTLVNTGRLPMLDRLRGQLTPESVFMSVPGVGKVLARRLVADLGLASLEDLEAAAHDGRLEQVLGVPHKTVAGIIDSMAQRLARIRRIVCDPDLPPPPVDELLDVDAEYRRRAAAGELHLIAPRRFNPEGHAWLPVLHTSRGERDYTVLFSNTARAHQLDRTGDWVIVYHDEESGGRQCTVVTETSGPVAGHRVVRGREAECLRYYAEMEALSERDRAA